MPTMMQNDRHGFFFALAAVLLWSTVATAFKITLSYLTPVQMVAVASSVSFVFLFAWVAISGELKAVWPALKTHPRYYLLLGLLNPLLYYLILFQAYALLPASQAQPLNYTWAIALTFMAALFLGQKIRKRDWIACFLGYCGVLVIATQGNVLAFEFVSGLGVALALISTFLWAGYWILNTRHPGRPVITLLLCFTLATPIAWLATFMLPWLGVSNLSAPAESVTSTLNFWQAYWQSWQQIPWQGWLAVSYVGLFEMGLTFVLWLKAMKMSSNTAKISNLIFISPFISLLLLALIIGEHVGIATVGGLLLIIGGLIVQQWQRRTPVAGEPRPRKGSGILQSRKPD